MDFLFLVEQDNVSIHCQVKFAVNWSKCIPVCLHSTLILHVVTSPSILRRRKWKWLYLRPLNLFQPVCAAPCISGGVREGMLRTANSLITPVYTFSMITLTGADAYIIFFPYRPGATQMIQPAFPAYSLYSPQQLLWLQHVYARQYYMQ